MDVSNTSALVTGAASGLGAATAAALADRGVRVIGVDLPAGIEKAPEVAGVTYHAADVTQPEDVRAAVAAAAEVGPLRT
uniref:SDR family NAD(P)-dependent oxidoreductase n=1 Tax=Kocuria atrinae TaxID=592377 RepID=UPI0004CE28EF